MDIRVLLKRSGMSAELESVEEFANLSKDLDNIVNMIAQLPELTEADKSDHNLYTKFMELAEDEYDKDATKEGIFANARLIEKDMFKVG